MSDLYGDLVIASLVPSIVKGFRVRRSLLCTPNGRAVLPTRLRKCVTSRKLSHLVFEHCKVSEIIMMNSPHIFSVLQEVTFSNTKYAVCFKYCLGFTIAGEARRIHCCWVTMIRHKFSWSLFGHIMPRSERSLMQSQRKIGDIQNH